MSLNRLELISFTDLAISSGQIDGVSSISKFGRNTAVALDTTEEIWDGSAAYSFPATALITSMSQTADQAAMRGETINIQGIDASWNLVSQDALLDATDTTTVVTLTTPLIRVFRAKVNSSVVGDQDIRIHNAGETQDYAVVTAGNNQTQMAIYTIPNGKTGYVTNYWAHHNPATGQDPTSNAITLWAADNDNGYAKQIKHVIGLPSGGGFQHTFSPYLTFTQKTDIYLTASPVGKAADVSAGFDIILIDN